MADREGGLPAAFRGPLSVVCDLRPAVCWRPSAVMQSTVSREDELHQNERLETGDWRAPLSARKEQMPTIKVNVQGEEVELEAARQGATLHVTRNGRTCQAQLVADEGESLLLELHLPDGTRQRVRVFAHLAGDKRQIWVNGRTFTYERVRERGSGGSGGDGSLAATIPAVVSQVLVKVGDVVAEGDKLILLESMKMVIPIQAPYDGTVTAVYCTPGESVPAGVPLLALETLSENQSP